MKYRLSTLRAADWWLIITIFALVLFGLSAIYSVALSQESDFLQLKKQLTTLGLALVLFIGIAFSNYRLLRNYSFILYIVGVLLLVGIFIFGTTVRGTTGWYTFELFSIQPVEFMKLALAVSLATYFSQRARRVIGAKEIIESGLLTAVPTVLTLMQPDFGSASLLVGTWLVVLLFSGVKKKHLLALISVFLVLSLSGWFIFLADYQKARIISFSNPTADPLGGGYHLNQAIIAVGAGGVFGRGLGFGSQSQLKFLPESQTDFIFAVIAEELGFLGIMLLLGAFAFMFIRIYLHATRTKDDFTSYLVIAIGGLLFVQFVVNVGMNLGLLPVTGVALPFVSYGGSSLLVSMVMLGIIESIAIRERRTE